MTNRFVAIAMVVWLISAALLGLGASAAGPKIVGGGLYGPGASVLVGPTNPANAAGFVFYSTNQPGYPLLVGADAFTAADGTNPALWAEDIGVAWATWAAGDIVVVVAETTRGVNGWAGVNHTSSIDGILATGGTVQDLGNGELEAFPTVTRTFGADYVQLSWLALADANGNVASYEVFHATSAAGPWTTAVFRVAQGASPAYNHTILGQGLHCYALGVNYDRDAGTGIYTTTGRTEPVCATLTGAAPFVAMTDPANAQGNVAATASIVVTFSEPMNILTVTWAINPSVVLTGAWTIGNTVLTLSHVTAFTDCSSYTAQITAGQDTTGSNLVGGPVPNPWTFTIACPSPYIVSTSPINGAAQVRRDTTLVIQFSETMNTASVGVAVAPGNPVTTFAWNGPTNDRLTVTFTAALTGGTAYTATVTGQDAAGNALVPGPVPNPWSFTTNSPPVVSLDPSSTLLGVCRTGGFGLDLPWTMSDTETSATNLVVWLNYTIGPTTGTISPGPLTGLSAPYVYTWTTPNTLNGDAQIFIEVADGTGETTNDIGGPVTIDSTAPTVLGATPANGATNVATDASVVITFSEAMDLTSTEAAFLLSPSPGTVTLAWSAGDTVLTITATFQASTQYTASVATSARDACDPGMTMASAFSLSFTTGLGPKRPLAPTGLDASATATAITLTWIRPTQYTDLSTLALTDIQEYEVFRATSANGTRTSLGTSTVASFEDTNVQAGTTYYYWVLVRDTAGRESVLSESFNIAAGIGPQGGFPVWVLLIPIIAILLIVGIWLLRRKKSTAAPPTAAKRTEGPKDESAPKESPEEPAKEGDFVACPNCGTMVKPADAECFVCGAKL